jgi:alditol oxidase
VSTNWAGNVSFLAARRHQPSSIDELRRLAAGCQRIKAIGTGHSFNPIADTTGDQVSLAGLPTNIAVDAADRQVSITGLVTYGQLAPVLDRAGYALANLGSLPHISVTGACMTGTHGSGDARGNLATSVAAIELVTAAGDLVRLDRSAPDFAGAVVSLGALGIVVSLALDIEPAYRVRQTVYENLPLAELDQLTEIFAAGYSVSLFTNWREPVINQVWVKQRLGEPDLPTTWHGARRASAPRHPVPGWPADSCTRQLGVPGPWHERLPHFRLDHTPSVGHELQSEYLLPREFALDAIRAVNELGPVVSPVLYISELRSVAADELWLSPSYQRDSIGLHFTWIDDLPAVLPVMAAVEERLAPFSPRPHWGKLFTIAPADLAASYERLPDFRTLMRRYDPAGKFRNAYLENLQQHQRGDGAVG